MFVAAIVQFAVCILILIWVLNRKPGDRYSKKAVMKFLLFGILSLIAAILLPLSKDTFFGMNPILSGFLTALLTAAVTEEISKYIFFRLAIFKNGEVLCWMDATIAAVVIAIGFTLVEDFEFAFSSGGGSIIRALMPAHILFQFVMGYYYGKARVTKEFKYDVLSVAVPILMHTLFDMFLIGIMSIIGDPSSFKPEDYELLLNQPYGNYLIPMLICAIAIVLFSLVGLILILRKIGIWNRNGERKELLKPAD